MLQVVILLTVQVIVILILMLYIVSNLYIKGEIKKIP